MHNDDGAGTPRFFMAPRAARIPDDGRREIVLEGNRRPQTDGTDKYPPAPITPRKKPPGAPKNGPTNKPQYAARDRSKPTAPRDRDRVATIADAPRAPAFCFREGDHNGAPGQPAPGERRRAQQNQGILARRRATMRDLREADQLRTRDHNGPEDGAPAAAPDEFCSRRDRTRKPGRGPVLDSQHPPRALDLQRPTGRRDPTTGTDDTSAPATLGNIGKRPPDET